MKHLFLALVVVGLALPVFGQNADEPPSRDEVILYLRTMRSHDMLQRIMQVQADSMRRLFRDMLQKEKGSVPADFDTKFKTAMEDLIKGMPSDQILDAMIPAYQQHFTKGDIEAMNAFYSSSVGQKVLQELPVVMQEGNEAAMPILSKYLEEWTARMKEQFAKDKNETSKPKTMPVVVQPTDSKN